MEIVSVLASFGANCSSLTCLCVFVFHYLFNRFWDLDVLVYPILIRKFWALDLFLVCLKGNLVLRAIMNYCPLLMLPIHWFCLHWFTLTMKKMNSKSEKVTCFWMLSNNEVDLHILYREVINGALVLLDWWYQFLRQPPNFFCYCTDQ